MAEELKSTEVQSSTAASSKKQIKRKRKRGTRSEANRLPSGKRPYPRVPLEKAIAVARAIKEKNGGNPWPAPEVANALGVSPKGVGFVYSLLSSKKFGLTEGTSVKGQVSLTDLGRQLVYSGTSEEELRFKRAAFLKVAIFKDVLDHYKGSKLPEMQYLGNTLESKFKLRPEFHREFSDLFKQNCEYVGLDSGADSTEAAEAIQDSRDERPSDVIVLGEPKTKTGLVCFVIMPFVEKSGQYAPGFFTEVLNTLIIPAAREAGFEVKTANRQGTEMIHSTIVNEILDADMCICDLTEHNPNVLFELGLRIAEDRPVALIRAKGTPAIFDVDNMLRVFEYDPNLWSSTVEHDRSKLTDHIKAAWENRESNRTFMKILRERK